jgi:hypothetical protein
MGGRLFQTPRINVEQYHQLVEELLPQIPCRTYVPKSYPKTSYGDIDILIEEPYRFPADTNHTNGPVYSFLYQGYQVDLVYAPDFEIACHYFDWNDLGQLLGKVARRFSTSYGSSGLVYRFEFDGGIHRIPLTKNYARILSFLGYEPHVNFNSLEDIFDYVVTSPFFRLRSYTSDLKHRDRKRNKSRETNHCLLTYLETYSYVELPVDAILRIDTFFPEVNIRSIIKLLEEQEEVRQQIKSNFNPDVVKSILDIDLTGPALGEFMKLARRNPQFTKLALSNVQQLVVETYAEYTVLY